jgi:hypothetical protein
MPAVIRQQSHVPTEDRSREAVVASEYEDAYEEGSPAIANIARFLAVIAAAILTVVGLIAMARIDWDAGMDAPAVGVADMAFTPEVAIATVVLGLLAIGCAAARDGDVRMTMGAIISAVGVAILLLNGDGNELQLGDRHGWLAFGVGAVLAVSGLLAPRGFISRRSVAQRRYVRDDAIDLR